MNDWIVLAIVVGTFSIVQSFFGVGLLVFGTPTLLLLGYPFDTALATLLPASLCISVTQVYEGRVHCALPARFFLCTLPLIAMGLALVLTGMFRPDMSLIVGTMLVFTAATRFSTTIRNWLRSMIERHFCLCSIATGLIHGLSNLGGGPLTIIMATLHRDRDTIRTNIAFAYLVFSAIQFGLLAALKPSVLSLATLLFPAISFTVYSMVGNKAYRRASDPAYQGLLTVFTFTFGLALFARRFL
jgi:uncharacterized membrane protein YfcA